MFVLLGQNKEFEDCDQGLGVKKSYWSLTPPPTPVPFILDIMFGLIMLELFLTTRFVV